MSERNDAETLTTAQDLTGALNTMAAEVKQLRTYGRRNRKYIVFDIALTILLAVATGVSAYAVQSAHDANVSAAAAHAVAAVATSNNRNLCLSNNVARAQQIDLWDYLLSISKAPRTAEQQKTVSAFQAHLRVIFQPRNCSDVSPGNP